MIQPFVLMNKDIIAGLERLGKTFLVSQRYYFGANYMQKDDDKIDLLFSDYPNKGLAEGHYNVVRGNTIKLNKDLQEAAGKIKIDKEYSAIIDLKNVKHNQKLQEMIDGPTYRLYWNATMDNLKVRQAIKSMYGEKIYRYIVEVFKWPMKGNDNLHITEAVIFGELFVNLKWGDYKERPALIDIENY